MLITSLGCPFPLGSGLWKISWDLLQCTPGFGFGLGFVLGFFFAGTDCRAEAAPAAVSSCLGCAEQPVSCSSAEPLNLSHHSLEGSCRADAICSFPTTLSAPVDGRIAGKY